MLPSRPRRGKIPNGEKVFLVEWSRSRARQLPGAAGLLSAEESLAELSDLAKSTGAQVTGFACQRTPEPDPATLVGRGKVEQIRVSAAGLSATCAIFGHDLTPTQLRNLEATLDLKVIDRTQLI
ncbi:MAG: hypothetical protein ACRD1I_08050, partial [Terriglobia bacterium]